jgi:hypothetical protein
MPINLKLIFYILLNLKDNRFVPDRGRKQSIADLKQINKITSRWFFNPAGSCWTFKFQKAFYYFQTGVEYNNATIKRSHFGRSLCFRSAAQSVVRRSADTIQPQKNSNENKQMFCATRLISTRSLPEFGWLCIIIPLFALRPEGGYAPLHSAIRSVLCFSAVCSFAQPSGLAPLHTL